MLYIRSIVPEPDPADGLISRACMAKYLLGLMAEDFSQTYCLVSWTAEVPLLFWQAAHGGEIESAFGPAGIASDERKLVLELAAVSGGWWTGSPGGREAGDAFLPLEEWRKRLATCS
jgi:hypothetical protein